MSAAAAVTAEEVFDLVAPVYIYHKADLKYRREAGRGLRGLKALKASDLAPHIGDGPAAELAEAARVRTPDDADPGPFWRAYELLFPALVTRELPELTPDHDRYGACCFRDGAGRVHLDGDACGHYPFYLDSAALAARLEKLREEM